MESALAWIGQIAAWIGQWIPRWQIFDVTTAGVKYVKGQPKECKAGRIHWYWPVTTTLDSYPVARQADDLRSQTIVTADDRTIVVGGMVVYEVTDIMLLLPHVFRASQAIKDLVLTCIHDVCCKMTWEELKAGQRKGTLDTKLKNAAREALTEYGVRVIKVQLTDLAQARVYKIMQTNSKDEE